MEKIDYELLKVRYELFGDSVETLALSINTPPDMLQQEIERRGWTPSNLIACAEPSTNATKPTDLASFAATFTETAKSKLTVLSLARQLAFADDYARIERKLLEMLFQNIKEYGEHPKILKELAGVFKDLTANSVTANIGKALQETDDKGGNLIVQIMNEIKGEKSETSVQAKVQ